MDPEGLSYITKSSRDIDIKADDDDDPLNEAPEDRADVATSKRLGDVRLGAWEDDYEETKRACDYLGASAPPLPGVPVPAEDSSPSPSPLAAEEDTGKPSPVANNETKFLSPPDEPALNSVVVPIGPSEVDSLPVALPIVTNAVGGGLNATLPLPEVPETAQPPAPPYRPTENKSPVARRKACSTKKILLVCLIVILVGGLGATLTILLWQDEVHEEEVEVHDPKEPPLSGHGPTDPKISDGEPEKGEPRVGDDGDEAEDPKIIKISDDEPALGESTDDGKAPYPNCHVDYPEWIGDGHCNDGWEGYDTEACGYDGGDCIEARRRYPNCNTFLEYLGNGLCDSEFGEGDNTEECGWGGGDCMEVNLYPKCRSDSDCVWYFGDGLCDDQYNSAEYGWDGGDCETEDRIADATDEGVGCIFNGKTYAEGDIYDALDGCNSCVCAGDGRSACTVMACHGPEKKEDNKDDDDDNDEDKDKEDDKDSDPSDWPKMNNRACTFHFGPNGVEGKDYNKWYDVDKGWCAEKCKKQIDKCTAYDFDSDIDRCRVFYTYPRDTKKKDGLTCWKDPNES